MLFSKILKRVFTVFILTLISLTAMAQGAKPAFWKVEHQGTTSYMLGSVHIGASHWYPLAPEIMKGFSNAKQLVVELDATDPVTAMAMQQQMMLPKGKTLKSELTPATYQKLSEHMAKMGMPIAVVEPYKPWAAATVVSVLPFLRAQLAPQYGVDAQFIARAKQNNMPLIELETAQFQIDMLEKTFSDEKMLVEIIDLPAQEALKLITLWEQGKMDGIEQLMVEQMSAEQIDEMLIKRNQDWIPKLGKLFNGKESTFVVVGAAHMIGEYGVPTLLSKAGYKVTRIQ